MFDPETMRKRFAELGAQRAAMVAKVAPLRQRYESMQAQEQQIRAQIRPILDELKAAEEPLFALDSERAIIVRALAGRTGEAG